MKQAKLNLHNLLYHDTYDHAFICTYTFEPDFFEDYCLEKFNSLNSNNNITVIVDHETYLHAISGLVENKTKQANLRYLLHPISVPGRFHVKIILFVSRKKGRLIIGSANFTKPGITSNAEMINYYDYEIEKKEEFKSLFQDVFSLLNEISNRWPSSALTSNLKNAEHDASWLVPEDAIKIQKEIILLDNLERPLWDQIMPHVTPPIDEVYILSRFFDENANLLNFIVKDLNPNKIKIYTQNGITTLTNNWLQHPLFKNETLEIYCCSYRDEGYMQNLHAKAIIMKKDNHCLLVFGSANFTSPALLRNSSRGNVETLILLKYLQVSQVRPAKLFDPLESGYRLKDDGTLQVAPRQEVKRTSKINMIDLQYAELVDNKIQVKMILKSDKEYDSLIGKIQFQDKAYSRVVLHQGHNDEYFTDPLESIVARLGEASSTIKVEGIKKSIKIDESNQLLIVNLLDIRNGKSLRRERYIREAQQSAIDFFRVLDNLFKEGDEELLIKFYNYCDIPVKDVSRPLYSRGMRLIWDGGMGMKSLGRRNLTIFNTLHESALSFFSRHLKKLQRHVKNGSINGVVNYLHIYLAMGGVLRSQIERLMQGLEACHDPLSPDEWYKYRNMIDTYFRLFKSLMTCLNDEYLANLLKIYKIEMLKEKFEPDLKPIKDLCSDMLSFYSRMKIMSSSNLKIKSRKSLPQPPPFFANNVFLPVNWVKYENEIDKKVKNILWYLAA